MPSLNGLGLKIQAHLQQHRPKLFQVLQETGKLKEYLLNAQTQAEEQLSSLEESGLRPDEAMEMLRDQIFPPSEEDQPNLNEPIQPYRDQPELTTSSRTPMKSRRDRRASLRPTSPPSSSSNSSRLKAV